MVQMVQKRRRGMTRTTHAKATRCDACGKRLRPGHHELHLSDLATGQVIGRYHAGVAFEGCTSRASKYMVGCATLRATIVHPDRCGAEQEACDVGRSLAEVAGAEL
jgi:hypothetical protein